MIYHQNIALIKICRQSLEMNNNLIKKIAIALLFCAVVVGCSSTKVYLDNLPKSNEMGLFTIVRMDHVRTYNLAIIYVDNKKIATIENQDKVSFSLPFGLRNIYFKWKGRYGDDLNIKIDILVEKGKSNHIKILGINRFVEKLNNQGLVNLVEASHVIINSKDYFATRKTKINIKELKAAIEDDAIR